MSRVSTMYFIYWIGSHDLDEDAWDENDEYLDYLESKGEAHDSADVGEDDDDESDNWSLDLMMEEDIYFQTVLDKLDAYNRFDDLMNNLSTKPDIYGPLMQSLSSENKLAIEGLLIKSREQRK